jgi:predicted O-methyltransferase YrrM
MVKRRHFTLLKNLAGVTRNPARAWRGIRLGRAAIEAGAIQKLSEVAPFLAGLGRPSCAIEIGAGHGGMLAALCAAAADDATIISVDLEGGPFGSGVSDEELLRRAKPRPGQTLHLVRGDSHESATRERVAALLPRPADVLFIDGDHTYDGVRSDYDFYRDLVRKDGMIAFHDILPHDRDANCQVDHFWREVIGTKREIVSPRELSPGGGTWGGIGILLKDGTLPR